MIVLALAAGAAQAQSLRVTGTAGYVSEWELNGEATQTAADPIKEFAGPLTLKHVGLCSRDGPQEEVGEIKFQILGSGSLSKIRATLVYLGTRAYTPPNCPIIFLTALCSALTSMAFLSRSS
jgi:hypothetical protein